MQHEMKGGGKGDGFAVHLCGHAVAAKLLHIGHTAGVDVLAVVVVALFVIVVLARYTAHKQKGAQNIHQAKKDKFFKPADVMVYLAVVLVI